MIGGFPVKTGSSPGEDREQIPFKLVLNSFQRPSGKFLKRVCKERERRETGYSLVTRYDYLPWLPGKSVACTVKSRLSRGVGPFGTRSSDFSTLWYLWYCKKNQKKFLKYLENGNQLPYLCTRFQRWRHEGLNRGEKKDEKEFFKILKWTT